MRPRPTLLGHWRRPPSPAAPWIGAGRWMRGPHSKAGTSTSASTDSPRFTSETFSGLSSTRANPQVAVRAGSLVSHGLAITAPRPDRFHRPIIGNVWPGPRMMSRGDQQSVRPALGVELILRQILIFSLTTK